MSDILSQSPAALCTQQPHLAIALHKLGIENDITSYSLETRLVLKGYEPTVVKQLLAATLLVRPVALGLPHTDMDLDELLADIVETHHSFLRFSVPRIEHTLATMVGQHDRSEKQYRRAAEIFSRLALELTLHMEKEEAYLFPLLQRSVSRLGRQQLAPLAISALLRELVDEHTHVADILDNLRQLLPLLKTRLDSGSDHALVDEIEEFEHDLRVHVCKENLLLFPMALAFESFANQQSLDEVSLQATSST